MHSAVPLPPLLNIVDWGTHQAVSIAPAQQTGLEASVTTV